MNLHDYSDEEINKELTRREASKRRKSYEDAIPTDEEQLSAKTAGMYFYKGPGGSLLVDWGDAHPYLISEHGRYLDWLQQYRSKNATNNS